MFFPKLKTKLNFFGNVCTKASTYPEISAKIQYNSILKFRKPEPKTEAIAVYN